MKNSHQFINYNKTSQMRKLMYIYNYSMGEKKGTVIRVLVY